MDCTRRSLRPRGIISPVCLCLSMCLIIDPSKAMTESEHLEGYYKRNYTWPLTATNPNTDGWRRKQFRRIAQVERYEDPMDRYNGWIHVISASVVVPNFTEHGWGLTRAPSDLVDELKASLHKGLANAREEHKIDCIEGELLPLFIPQKSLNEKVLNTLQPMHEAWSGQPLKGTIAYGLRAYRNGSVLLMHIDRVQTHVISCILHVDHSEDSEPWPLFIEDLQGNTHEIVLESGDMLFYESAKCIHGRPRRFQGSWYSSIFVHYYPVHWEDKDWESELHYAVPPQWRARNDVVDPNLDRLTITGTSLFEPECPDLWCGTNDTIKWYGPAKEGVVITTGNIEGSILQSHKAGDEL